MVSWQRPINLDAVGDTLAVDARTNGNIFYILDFIKLYDWRGPQAGYMYAIDDVDMTKNHFWFWAYYNVKAIHVDMTPSRIKTNLHHNGEQPTYPLSSISTELQLLGYPSMANGPQHFYFDLLNGTDGQPFNSADKEDDIEAFMGVNPVDVNKKLNFGAIYYANNGENVTEFDVVIPFQIEYEWGTLPEQYVKIHVKSTEGNDN